MGQKMMRWQWHQLDHMQIICNSLQTDNHASTSLPDFYTPDALPDAQPTVKALKANEKPPMKRSRKWLPNRLFSLGLPHFRFLVSFSENIVERSAGDGTLELDSAPRAFLLHLFLHSLLVLAPIQNRPVHFARVPLRVVQLHTFGIYKVKSLTQQTNRNSVNP